MRKRIARIAPLQLGKVGAVFYGLFTIPIAVIMGIVAALSPPQSPVPWGFIVAMPILYIVGGFLFMLLAAWLYNVTAKWTGGVEFESEEVSDA